MPVISFWNINKTSQTAFAVDLLNQYGVDILILAEAKFDPPTLIYAYAQAYQTPIYSLGLGHEIARVKFYSRFPNSHFRDVLDRPYLSAKEYTPIIGQSFLIIAVHLPSKTHQDSIDQPYIATRVRSWIEEAERQVGHSRTVLVGDFNMNPFENPMVSSDAIHGVMDRRIATLQTRRVLHEDHEFFYNPMWKLMGDSRNASLGTYFLRSGNAVHYFWHTFDQVLVRPALLPFFSDDDISIIETLNGHSLLASSQPGINATISDHLPLIFQLNT